MDNLKVIKMKDYNEALNNRCIDDLFNDNNYFSVQFQYKENVKNTGFYHFMFNYIQNYTKKHLKLMNEEIYKDENFKVLDDVVYYKEQPILNKKIIKSGEFSFDTYTLI